jgi:putative PIN family toxin of toxin-antitoxin system
MNQRSFENAESARHCLNFQYGFTERLPSSSREQMLVQVRMLAEVMDPPPLAQPVCRDPDDDAVLALARAAQADVIVSGDDDLLSLTSFESIPILNPAQALARVGDWA